MDIIFKHDAVNNGESIKLEPFNMQELGNVNDFPYGNIEMKLRTGKTVSVPITLGQAKDLFEAENYGEFITPAHLDKAGKGD
jgi:hypothetical protein